MYREAEIAFIVSVVRRRGFVRVLIKIEIKIPGARETRAKFPRRVYIGDGSELARGDECRVLEEGDIERTVKRARPRNEDGNVARSGHEPWKRKRTTRTMTTTTRPEDASRTCTPDSSVGDAFYLFGTEYR